MVAVVGVGFLIGGAIGALIGVRQLVVPDPGQETREAVRDLLQGLAFALPGAAAALWHVSQARAREGRVVAGAFWGGSLYFHLVALVAFVTALGGVTASLFALVDAALPPRCFAIPAGMADVFHVCTSRSDALRSALNGLIVVLVAGAVWWWHLRQGRRIGAAPAPPSSG